MNGRNREWVLFRHRLRDDAWGVLLLWAGFTLAVFALILTVAAFRGPLEVSGWEVASQLPRWFAGGIGVYLAAVYLPLYVAHGYTRREVARQLPPATAVTVVLLSALMTLGFALERVLYSVAGWTQALTQPHLFVTADSYGLVLVEFVLLFAVWVTAGALAGAAFYRGPGLGLLLVPLPLAMVGMAEAVLNPGFFELVTAVFGFIGLDPEGVSTLAAVSVALGCIVVAAPVTWLLVRDLPIRSQSS